MFQKIRHFFIPEEKNNHRASLLKPNFLLLFLILYLLNQSVLKSLTTLKPGILGYSSEITVQKVLDQTNAERTELGLSSLTFSSTLSESARQKAEDMFEYDYWAHNSPQGKTPWTFFENVGYEYSIAGENLAKDFYDTDSLIEAWMNSPTHRDNIVNSKYQEIGIAVVNGTLGGIKTTLVVQHFGTPLGAVADSSAQESSEDVVQPEIVTQSAEEESVVEDNVLANTSEKLISPLSISKTFNIVIFVGLIIILFIDGFITIRKDIHRLTGSTFSHIGFLLFILSLMLFNQQGSIF